MADITLTLSEPEVREAIRKHVQDLGFEVTDRFGVRISSVPGDRPFDAGYTSASVSGVKSKEPSE